MSEWVALHGFLGCTKQWDFLNNLGNVNAIDLYPMMDMSKDEMLDEILKNIKPGAKLIGYSMGGRIAMELFLKKPDVFSKLYILAAHPGLSSEEEKEARRNWELSWVEKIENESFIKDWNDQPIFKNDQPVELIDVKSKYLKSCFLNWGLSKQENLIPKLIKYNKKITWMIGSEDKKYKEIAGAQIKEFFYTYCVTGAGHRLLQHQDSLLNILKILDKG